MFNEFQLNIHHSSSNSVDISSIQEYSNGEEYEVIDGYDDIALDEDFATESEEIVSMHDVVAVHEEEYWDTSDPIYTCVFCNTNMWDKERLSRTNGHARPYFGLCCMDGNVELPVLKLAPKILQDFHFKDDDMSRYFKKNIRLFNSMFSFTSMVGRINNNINNGTAPLTLLLSGQNNHCVGSLLPSVNNSPKFAQLYIYDTDNEQSNSSNGLERVIVAERKSMLDLHNPLASTFRYARERRYNLPTASEVAVIVIGDIDESCLDRDIIIESRSSQLKRIDVFHSQYLALQYPLLFSYAEEGYRIGIETSNQYNTNGSKKRKIISMREFFSYRLQMRFPGSPILLHSSRLFQQFLVDAYTMVEAERLNFIRFNQPKLSVERYKVLHESLVSGQADAVATDQRIITITSNSDAFGKLMHLLFARLSPQDRPDVVSRTFKIKLNNLISEFKSGIPFGKIVGYVCTVEFQNRGLPHAHILLFMHPTNKPKSPSDIDRFISAEIPDRLHRPRLYAAVERFMVHGPCGRHNKNSPCMVDGHCSKYFPKKFRSRTVIDEARFPKYKRPDNGRTITKRNVTIDNSFIVPYNLYLLLTYGCYINVEQTCQTSAIKYLFKYMHKGNDRVVDKIQNYYDCRYISSCEVDWRIFGYDIQIKEPVVIKLPFRLPEEHAVIFRDNDNIQDVLNRVDGKLTKLLAWFLANSLYPFFRSLTYSEFPNKFVWKDDSCYQQLSEDILYIHRRNHRCEELQLSDEQILNLTLVKIEERLQENGRSLREFSTLSYPDMQNIDGVVDRFLMDEMNFDREFLHEEFKDSLKSMTHEQRNAYDWILNAVSMDLGGFYFVYGYGGTGKTFLYRTLSASLRCNGKIVLNVASSGIASLLLPNGRTAHSRFKIPLNINEDLDEASMLNKHCYKALNKSLKDILRFEKSYKPDMPFGRKVIVLGGDFRQILPVIPMGSR
ncbi:uncharacterized protein LOC107615951 [Arachis ipaensis]|uniref:uncharacterized protein LOC107615951 n=1 Tax=Arachis ipaensis TaxID=130454 RepID=UPI0007AF779B|nr:uncharacterized protein LOC107615951 [Arachis ipaensis]